MSDCLWLMSGACLLIAICSDGGGDVLVVPNVHLHRFSALHLTCPEDRVARFLIELLCLVGCG